MPYEMSVLPCTNQNTRASSRFFSFFVAGPAGLGFAIAKPSVPPRSKYREQALDIYSLRRPVEPTVLVLLKTIRIKIRLLRSLLLILAGPAGYLSIPVAK